MQPLTNPGNRPIWLGLGVGLGVGLARDNLMLGAIAGLIAWAVATAYLRYKQVS